MMKDRYKKKISSISLQEDSLQHLLEEKVPLLKKALLQKNNHNLLKDLIANLHPSELAYLIQYLENPYRESFFTWLKPDINPEFFLYLTDSLREEIFSLLSNYEIARILCLLDAGDALSLLSSLEEEQREIILKKMPFGKKHELQERLLYPQHSAGRLMQKEVLALPRNWTVKQAVSYISKTESFSSRVYDAFIIDIESRSPIGSVSLSDLMRYSGEIPLEDIMDHDIRTVLARWDQDEVSFIFRLYDLIEAPVVNDRNELIGVITIDHILDVIEKKATEDLMRMGRIRSSDFHASVFQTSFQRLHWLIITLINTLLTSVVIDQFQYILQKKVTLTILMPIAAAMGGNCGIQTATVIIRALATRELSSVNLGRTFLKEIKVSLTNGLIFSILLGLVTYCWFQDFSFSFILGVAIVFNMLWAGLAGTFFPLFIARIGFDPALGSGPLLTTTTDVIGYAVFLGFADFFLVS